MGGFAKFVASTALLVGGLVIGMTVDDDPPTRPEGPRQVVEVPKYIERTETITKEVFPEVCQKAVKVSQDLSKAVSEYETQVSDLPRILDDAYLAIHNKSLSDINGLKTRQHAAESGSIASLVEIRSSLKDLEILQAKCKEALD